MKATLLSVMTCLAASALGGENRWTPHGPNGGTIREVVPHPSRPQVAYGLGKGGLFRTEDSGGSWSRSSEGLTDLNVRALAVLSGATELMLLTTEDGIYRSRSGGRAWTRVLNGRSFEKIAISPRDRGVYATSGLAVFRSSDEGESWEVGAPLPSVPTCVLAPPGSGERLFAVTSLGLVLSDDGALSWRTTSLPWIATSLNRSRSALMAGTISGLYRSTDSGDTWTPAGIGGYVWGVAASPDSADVYAFKYDASFRSSDGGLSWGSFALPPSYWATHAALGPGSPGALFLNGKSLYRSLDGAENWLPTGGFPAETYALNEAPDGTLLLADEAHGVSVSDDRARTWAATTGFRGPPSVFARNGIHPDWVYAGGAPDEYDRPSFYGSTDSGRTWRMYFSGYHLAAADSVGHDFAGTSFLSASGYQTGIIRASDGYMWFYWSEVDAWMGQVFELLSASKTLLARSSRGVYRCRTGGADDWEKMLASTDVRAMAVEPSRTKAIQTLRLYASAFRGQEGRFAFLGSTDGGESWRELPFGEDVATSIAVAPAAEEVFACGQGGCRWSHDGGQTWIAAGLEAGASVRSLHISPGPPRTVYATTTAGLMALTGTYVHGDLDADGSLDVKDLVILASYLVGNTLPGETPFLAPLTSADGDRDRRVDLFDLVRMAGAIVSGGEYGGDAMRPISPRAAGGRG